MKTTIFLRLNNDTNKYLKESIRKIAFYKQNRNYPGCQQEHFDPKDTKRECLQINQNNYPVVT